MLFSCSSAKSNRNEGKFGRAGHKLRRIVRTPYPKFHGAIATSRIPPWLGFRMGMSGSAVELISPQEALRISRVHGGLRHFDLKRRRYWSIAACISSLVSNVLSATVRARWTQIEIWRLVSDRRLFRTSSRSISAALTSLANSLNHVDKPLAI